MALALDPINLAGNYPRQAYMAVPAQATATNAPAAEAAAAITITGLAGRKIILDKVWATFVGGTPASSLTVEDGSGNTVWGPHYLGSVGPHAIDFGLHGSVNTDMIVTVAAPGTGVTAVLSVKARAED